MSGWLLSYSGWLLGTILIEAVVVAVLARRSLRLHALGAVLCLNLVTHPLATWATLAEMRVLPMEIAVTVVEAVGYRLLMPWSTGRALGAAVLANAITFGAALAFA